MSQAADKKWSVMVVDDDSDVRAVMAQVLELEGFDVFEAENGREALDVLEKALPDLILLDLMMPVMNGWEFSRALKARAEFTNIPVVAVTAGTLNTKNADGLLVQGYMKKPISLEGLMRMVREFCN